MSFAYGGLTLGRVYATNCGQHRFRRCMAAEVCALLVCTHAHLAACLDTVCTHPVCLCQCRVRCTAGRHPTMPFTAIRCLLGTFCTLLQDRNDSPRHLWLMFSACSSLHLTARNFHAFLKISQMRGAQVGGEGSCYHEVLQGLQRVESPGFLDL